MRVGRGQRPNDDLDILSCKWGVHTMAFIAAKYGRSLKFSTNCRPIRACFLNPPPGTSSGMYLIIGIRSTRSAPTLAAFARVSIADSASSMKGSSIGFIPIPYANDRAVSPTALNSSSINDHVANRPNTRGPTYCLDILKNSLGASRRRSNIFRIDSISMG